MLNNFNQRIISILGSLTILALSVIILLGAFFLISDLFPSDNYYTDNSGITLDSEESVKEQKLRDQEISMSFPVRVDSARQIFVIPVSQVNLEEAESIESILGIMNSSSNSRRNISYGPSYSSNSDYNNLVIFNYLKDKKKIVFQTKTLIDQFSIERYEDKSYILMRAIQEDSNNDKKLNGDDLSTFFIYDVLEEKLYSYKLESASASRYERLYDSPEIVIVSSLDKNKDGRINSSKEPRRLKQVSLIDFSIKDVIDIKMLNQIQSIVD